MSAVTVTVLFTDLVDSTQLLSDLGEDAAEELRREHFGLLRAAVAAAGGREVKNLGDGLMVAFDGVGAALGCAVEMQQAITARPPTLARMSIRVGIAVGEAEQEDDDYFGLPVVQAARLCAKAQGGEILVTDVVKILAGTRGGFDLEPVGPLELKGLDEPVDGFRLRWRARPAAAQPPLPARLHLAESAAFVGRAAEHERLAQAWKAVVAGERRVALLAGEPGIGKTTLAGRLARAVHEQGAIVLYGRSDEDLGVPYQPWVEALGHLVAHLPDDVLEAHVADRGPSIARLVPELGRRTGAEVSAHVEGDAERFVLFGCVTDLLERAARVRPVLLVLDDLHWADRPTTQLLRHLVANVASASIGVVVTYRDSDVASGDPASELLAALHREQGVDRISLRGLSDADLLDLLERVAGHELDEAGVALRDAVLEETAGNPFFVGEVLRHLAESGALVQDETGRWSAGTDVLAAGLPVSVREVIGQRVARLGSECERLLTLASVIGRDFEIGLLARVADVDEDAVLDACDAATAAAVLRATDEPERYTFNHALIEHTLYDSLSPARRTRAHRAVAEAIEELVGDDPGRRAGELAFHWGHALVPADGAKAARYAQLAGDRALAQLAPDEALRWYAQALDRLGEAGTSRQRTELLIGFGDAQRQAGVAAYRDTLLEAAHLADAADDVDLLVRSVLTNNRGMYSNTFQMDEDRNAMIDRALDRLGPEPSIERARLLALACIERIYGRPLAERFELAEEAVAIARACGDPEVLTLTFVFCSDGISVPSTLELRRRWTEEAEPLAGAVVNPATRYLLHNWIRFSAMEWGDVEAVRRSDRLAKEALALAPHAGLQWNNAFHQVWQAIVWGDLGDAERLAERAFEVGTASGEPDALVIFGAQLLSIRNWQGRLGEMVPLVEQAMETASDPVYRATLAVAHATAGDARAAIALLDAELERGLEIPENYGWSTTCNLWADAAVSTGHAASAAPLIEALAPHRPNFSSNGCLMGMCFAHHLGQLEHLRGRHDEADALFAEALAAHERIGSAMFVAHTQAAWAALLADRGRGDDREHAERLARAALACASAGGYSGVERDAIVVLQRLGVGF